MFILHSTSQLCDGKLRKINTVIIMGPDYSWHMHGCVGGKIPGVPTVSVQTPPTLSRVFIYVFSKN